MTDLRAIPTLDELDADPVKMAGLSVEIVEALLARCHTLEGRLLARLLAARPNGHAASPDERLLSAGETAQVLGRTIDWVYRHARDLPFAVQQSKGHALRFSREGIERYVRERQGLSR